MKNEQYWDGFILGLFVGGIIGIVIYDLVIRGIL
jgi:glycerol uptake facilitator-like aquaporin